jgi:nucleoid-associated protein YgaU
MFVRIFVLAGLALLVWSAVARPSGAHGHKVTYRVQPYDTLWTIASTHYGGGDVRDAVWQIEHANHLRGTGITPGEKLVLP